MPEKLLAQNFIHCPRDDLIILISRMLKSLISINDGYTETSSDSISPSSLTRFHSRTPPGISVYNYLARLARYSSLENAVLLASIYYIDLLSTVQTSFTLNSLTVHRFLLTATAVGSKGLCDSFCTNSHYAKVGGIHATELDVLERDFLTKINYRILPRENNIEICAKEYSIENGKERKKSIDALEDGRKLQEHDYNSSNGETDQSSAAQNEQGGYTVLDRYYRKMIDLVGDVTSLDEPEVSSDTIYKIDSYTTGKEDLQNMIKTEPDTLPEEKFQQMMRNLIAYYKQAQQRNRLVHPTVAQVRKDTMNLNLSTNNKNTNESPRTTDPVPLSPLKRPIEPDAESKSPKGKRSVTEKKMEGKS